MSIRAIIWDMEGVILLNSQNSIPVCIAKRLDISIERLLQTAYDKEYSDQIDLGDHTQEEGWEHMLDNLGLPYSKKTELEKFFREDFYIDQELVARHSRVPPALQDRPAFQLFRFAATHAVRPLAHGRRFR